MTSMPMASFVAVEMKGLNMIREVCWYGPGEGVVPPKHGVSPIGTMHLVDGPGGKINEAGFFSSSMRTCHGRRASHMCTTTPIEKSQRTTMTCRYWNVHLQHSTHTKYIYSIYIYTDRATRHCWAILGPFSHHILSSSHPTPSPSFSHPSPSGFSPHSFPCLLLPHPFLLLPQSLRTPTPPLPLPPLVTKCNWLCLVSHFLWIARQVA